MTEYKQTRDHNPEAGSIGDCYRTAIGCLLDLQPCDVPHFFEDQERSNEEGLEEAEKFVNGYGCTIIRIAYKCDEVSDALLAAASWTKGYYMLVGSSPRAQHVVICEGAEMVWDPSMTDDFLIGPAEHGYFYMEFLGKKFH